MTPNPSLRNFSLKKELIERMIRLFDLDVKRMEIKVRGEVVFRGKMLVNN